MKSKESTNQVAVLSNAQIEILKMFSRPMRKNEITDLKQVLKNFLSERIDNEVDEIWEKRNLSQIDMDNLLNTHTKRTK